MKIVRKICQIINHRVIYKTKWWDTFWGGTTKFWNIKEFNLQVVNLGSNSGKYSFCYERLPIKGQNWAIGPQSLVHDFSLLRNYFSYIGQRGIVLIPLCPFSGRFSPYERAKRFKYYPIFHPATIESFEDSERTRAYRIKNNPIKEIPLKCIKATVKEWSQMLKNRLKGGKRQIDFENDAHRWIDLWMKQFKLESLETPLNNEEKEQQDSRAATLKDIIDFCMDRDLKPYIVIPPVHRELSDLFSDACKKQNIYQLIQKATDNADIVLDYFTDTRFQKDEYFQNAYFMNKLGAKTFTKQVLADIGLIKP